MDITFEQQAKIFKALSDERRLQILELLKNGEECACNLGQQLDMAQSTLSYHIEDFVRIWYHRQQTGWEMDPL